MWGFVGPSVGRSGFEMAGLVSIEQRGGAAAASPGTEPQMFLHARLDPSPRIALPRYCLFTLATPYLERPPLNGGSESDSAPRTAF